jgi:hypothetical protein
MRVSFTDQWPTFLDENGKPLIGRIKFMKADASQFKNVYYENNLGQEVLAPNPCYTLQDGRLEHQVFLDYGVYTCIVEKFIGNDWQNMLDYADDPTYWDELKRFKAYGGEDISTSASDLGSGFCDTIADLRLINPTEHSVVDVVGYYSKDDGIAPRTYVWVEGDTAAEDFGGTIVSSLTDFTGLGRWKLCESPIVCSTTFGVFPDRGSTITESELSQKASAFAQYVNASNCNEAFFPAGHYYFASGTTLSFSKKVTTNGIDTNPVKFDMNGVQQEGNTLEGSVSISFLGGFEALQDTEICDNGTYTKFTFGAGSIKTSWIKYGLADHIDNSSTFKDIKCIINYNSATTFCSQNKVFDSWTFIRTESAGDSQHSVPQGCSFKKSSFIGNCFNVGNNCTFIECGDVRTKQISKSTALKDNCIWNTDGSIKSTGTMFLIDNSIEFVQTYYNNAVIDNSNIKIIDKSAFLLTRIGLVQLKYEDRLLNFKGAICFKNKDVYADQYLDGIDDCFVITSSVSNSDIMIDLCGGEYEFAYTNEDSVPVRNGMIDIDFSGIQSGITPMVKAENASVTFSNIPSGKRFAVYGKNADFFKDSDGEIVFEDANCDGCSFHNIIPRLVSVSTENLVHSFTKCFFFHPITLDGTTDSSLDSVYCNVNISNCTFNFSSEDYAIKVDNRNRFKADYENKYVICNNILLGDAKMLPVDEVSYTMTTKFNGQTPSEGEYSGTFITPAYDAQTAGIAGGQSQYVAQVNSNGYALSSLSERIFHVGTPNISVEITANPNFSDFLYYVIPANTALGKTNGSSFSFSSGIFILFNNTSNGTTNILSVDSNVRIKRILA